MLKTLMIVTTAVLCVTLSGFAGQEASTGTAESASPKILIVYYSRTGNTQDVAREIHDRIGGDLFQVENKTPYPGDYTETTRVAKEELNNNARPELAKTVPPDEMAKYDVIFVGFPTWWGTMPMAMFTFLEQYDLAGKTIVPFCTHGGSGLDKGPADIEKLCPGATVRQGLAIRGGASRESGEAIAQWLRDLGYLKAL